MSAFGQALAGGLAGAADSASGILGAQIKEDFDKRASDRSLANQERLLATQEMMRQRSDEWKAGREEAKDTRTYDRQMSIEEQKTARQEAELEYRTERDAAKDERERDIADQRHKQTLAAISGKADKTTQITDAEGILNVVGADGKAKRVTGEDGNPFRTGKAADAEAKRDADAKKATAQQIAQKEKQVATLYGKEKEQAKLELAEMKKGAGMTTSAAPYPDGTRLKGKDGKTYVVRNGKPVAE